MTLTIQNAYENNSINGNGIYALLVGPAHQLNKVPQFVHIEIGYCHINHAGLIPHTSHKLRSSVLDTDGKYSFTFHDPGTYKYFCSAHPHMTGKVIVQ